MPFFNIIFFRVVLFVFDFSRCYANSFRIIFLGFIQMKFIFKNKKFSFLNNIADMYVFRAWVCLISFIYVYLLCHEFFKVVNLFFIDFNKQVQYIQSGECLIVWLNILIYIYFLILSISHLVIVNDIFSCLFI